MTGSIKKSDELENRVQSLESDIKELQKFQIKATIIVKILSALGVLSVTGIIAGINYYSNAANIVREAKNDIIETSKMVDSVANEAKTSLEKIRGMEISQTLEELREAKQSYHNISTNLDSAITQYQSNSEKYNRIIEQLTGSVDLYIPQQAAAEEREYLMGYIFDFGESEEVMIRGRKVLKQRVRLTFDDSTRSILPILARGETLRVQFLYPK